MGWDRDPNLYTPANHILHYWTAIIHMCCLALWSPGFLKLLRILLQCRLFTPGVIAFYRATDAMNLTGYNYDIFYLLFHKIVLYVIMRVAKYIFNMNTVFVSNIEEVFTKQTEVWINPLFHPVILKEWNLKGFTGSGSSTYTVQLLEWIILPVLSKVYKNECRAQECIIILTPYRVNALLYCKFK